MTEERRFGAELQGWQPPLLPGPEPLRGQYATLEPLEAERHAALLYGAYDGHDRVWDYMPVGPFASAAQFHRWMKTATAEGDPYFYAIWDKDAEAYGGFASYLRMKPASGSIEIGYIAMAPQLQKTRVATEALYLMLAWAFEAGYRRVEWKCDALNRPSRRAAQRLGFSYEGVFRQATVVKNRNRDTAWFAVIDAEWPALREAFSLWLSPANFPTPNAQVERLSDLTRLVRASSDPAL